jgi:hypothetical protein
MCLVASFVEAAPLHCLGSQGANCEAGRCESQETHVDLTLEQTSNRAELCIGENCYAGPLRLAAASGALEGDFSGQGALRQAFSAHVALTGKHDAATLTWGDGVVVAMAFVKCEAERTVK